MRLIDADNLKVYLQEYLHYGHAIPWVDAQPTAYDVDAVIADLKERTEFLKDCTKYGNESAEQQEKSHSPMMMYEVADLMDDLIDIVERGGINE